MESFDILFSDCIKGLATANTARRMEVKVALICINANLHSLARTPRALAAYKNSAIAELQSLYLKLN